MSVVGQEKSLCLLKYCSQRISIKVVNSVENYNTAMIMFIYNYEHTNNKCFRVYAKDTILVFMVITEFTE
jgi:hypothetical protein